MDVELARSDAGVARRCSLAHKAAFLLPTVPDAAFNSACAPSAHIADAIAGETPPDPSSFHISDPNLTIAVLDANAKSTVADWRTRFPAREECRPW